MREVAEEVGLATACDVSSRPSTYWYWDTYRKDMPELVHKRVDFYLLRVVGGELSDSSFEVDGTAWFRPGRHLPADLSGRTCVVQAAIARLIAP